MRNKLKIFSKGHLKATAYLADGSTKVLYDGPNAINNTPGCEIVAHSLGGDTIFNINQLTAYKASSPLKSRGFTRVDYPNPGQVEFTAVFLEADSDDTLDELGLESAGWGKFSQVTGLSIHKDSTMRLAITWTITIQTLL